MLLLKAHEWNYIEAGEPGRNLSIKSGPRVFFFEDGGRLALWTRKNDLAWIAEPDGKFDSGYVWKK